jgi:hypothetical protein
VSSSPGRGGVSTSACKQVIKIGVSYSSDEGTAFGAFGGNAATAANTNAYVAQEEALDDRMATYINSTGGLAGCQIALGFHDYHILGSDGFSGETQSECSDFAEDQKVFAVINTIEETGALIPCLAEHHVVDFFGSIVYQPSPADFQQYHGYLYQPDSMTSYRFGPYIQLLAKVGYFGSGAKVGILLADDGSGHNQYLVNDLWTPALKAMGITPVVFTYTNGNGSSSSIANESSAFSSAVLEFKTQGVNHVIMTPDGGNAVFLFPPQAQSQSFTPRYAMTTASGAAAWTEATPQEQANAVDVSYSTADVEANANGADMTQMNTNPTSSTRSTCLSIYTGHMPSGSQPQAQYQLCDDFLLMQAALKGAAAVTPATLLAGMNRIGSSFALAGAYGNSKFGPPDHYDGAPAVRVCVWNSSTKEWVYVTPPAAIP